MFNTLRNLDPNTKSLLVATAINAAATVGLLAVSRKLSKSVTVLAPTE